MIAQDGPPVPNLRLSVPHAGWRWPVSTEASLHLHSQCSHDQLDGPCWCQHYRGQCRLLGPCLDWLLLLRGSDFICCMYMCHCITTLSLHIIPVCDGGAIGLYLIRCWPWTTLLLDQGFSSRYVRVERTGKCAGTDSWRSGVWNPVLFFFWFVYVYS